MIDQTITCHNYTVRFSPAYMNLLSNYVQFMFVCSLLYLFKYLVSQAVCLCTDNLVCVEKKILIKKLVLL